MCTKYIGDHTHKLLELTKQFYTKKFYIYKTPTSESKYIIGVQNHPIDLIN